MKLTRREMIQATAPGRRRWRAVRKSPPPAPGAPRFFTAAEFAVVDELSDMIIPTDQQSGGARARAWRPTSMLASPNRSSPSRRRAGGQACRRSRICRASSPARRLWSRRPSNGWRRSHGWRRRSPTQDAGRTVLRVIKGSTIRAYYTSKIGIHEDQQYKGNVYQMGEFAGFGSGVAY